MKPNALGLECSQNRAIEIRSFLLQQELRESTTTESALDIGVLINRTAISENYVETYHNFWGSLINVAEA